MFIQALKIASEMMTNTANENTTSSRFEPNFYVGRLTKAQIRDVSCMNTKHGTYLYTNQWDISQWLWHGLWRFFSSPTIIFLPIAIEKAYDSIPFVSENMGADTI
jgi:hypothetical protein